MVRRLDVERFHVGCGVALCLVGADLVGVAEGSPALVALFVAGALAYRRSDVERHDSATRDDPVAGNDSATRDGPVAGNDPVDGGKNR